MKSQKEVKNIRIIHPIDTKNQLALSILKFMSEVGKDTKKKNDKGEFINE